MEGKCLALIISRVINVAVTLFLCWTSLSWCSANRMITNTDLFKHSVNVNKYIHIFFQYLNYRGLKEEMQEKSLWGPPVYLNHSFKRLWTSRLIFYPEEKVWEYYKFLYYDKCHHQTTPTCQSYTMDRLTRAQQRAQLTTQTQYYYLPAPVLQSWTAGQDVQYIYLLCPKGCVVQKYKF